MAIGAGGVGAYGAGGLAGLAGYGARVGGGVLASEATRTYSPSALKAIAPGKDKWRYELGGQALGAAGFIAGMKATGVGISGARATAQYVRMPKTQVLKSPILGDSTTKVIGLKEKGGIWQAQTQKYKPFDLTKLKAEKLGMVEDMKRLQAWGRTTLDLKKLPTYPDWVTKSKLEKLALIETTQQLRQATRPVIDLSKYPTWPTAADKKAEKLAKLEQSKIFQTMERDTSIWAPRPLAKYSELRKAFELQKTKPKAVRTGKGTYAVQIERSFLAPGSYAQLAKTLPRAKPIIKEAEAFKPTVSEKAPFAKFAKTKSIFKTPKKTLVEKELARGVITMPKLENYAGILAPIARAAFVYRPRLSQTAWERQRLAESIGISQRSVAKQKKKAIVRQRREDVLLPRTGVRADIVQKQAEKTRQDLKALQRTFLRTFIREKTRTRQRLRERTKTKTKTRTRPQPSRFEWPRLSSLKGMASLGFGVQVRRRGRFRDVKAPALTRESAKRLGSYLVDVKSLGASFRILPVKSLGASFRILPKAGRGVSLPGLPAFRAERFRKPVKGSKLPAGTFIEKAKFRLSSPREILGIQKARRGKALKLAF
jgi:hypothetical protein